MLERRLHVETARRVNAALGIARGHHARAILCHQSGDDRSGITEALHGHARILQFHPADFAGFPQSVKRPARRRFMPSLRATERQRFAGHNAQLSVAVHHGNRVHDPRHRLRVGVNIRRRNVPIGPDDRSDFESIPAGESLELIL